MAAISLIPAQTARIAEVVGRVEIQPPGGSWTAARTNTTLDLDSMISTGFGASAVLEIGDATINVGPITRISLNELSRQGDTVTTDLSLRVGRVETEVKSTSGLRNDFQIRSPYSTASVRGTKWAQTINRVQVINGVVAVFIGPPPARTKTGTQDGGTEEEESGDEGDQPQPVLVEAGGSVEISVPMGESRRDRRRGESDGGGDRGAQDQGSETPRVTSGESALQDQSNTSSSNKPVVAPITDDDSDGGDTGGTIPPPSVPTPVVTTGSVSVRWTW